jgi:hypothetical protein
MIIFSFLVVLASICLVSPTGEAYHKGVVLTSFLSNTMDPVHLGRQYSNDIMLLRNFYFSARVLNLSVLVLHDNCSSGFVRKLETPQFRFERMPADLSPGMSTNDRRFHGYNAILPRLVDEGYSHVLFADISDTFFWRNPFEYMVSRQPSSLFFSRDHGSILPATTVRPTPRRWSQGSNPWYEKAEEDCYGRQRPRRSHDEAILNAGVWGGLMAPSACLVRCIARETSLRSQPRKRDGSVQVGAQTTKAALGFKNCNMPAFNWCVRRGECGASASLGVAGQRLVNPFGRQCLSSQYAVIHNKCRGSAGRLCLTWRRDKSLSVERMTVLNNCAFHNHVLRRWGVM